MQEQLQKLMSDHAKMLSELNHLVAHFDNLRKVFVEMGEAAVALGHQINLLSALAEAPPDDTARNALLDKAPFFLKYEMAPAMREWVEGLVTSLRAGNGIAKEWASLAPVEQWPQIGNTVEIGFVARNGQLILRAVVEVVCHEHTSESAENDFCILHPRAEGVRTTFAEWPSAAGTEMAVHAPSEIPPVRYCSTDCVLVENHDGLCVGGDGADIATMLSGDNVVDPVPGQNIFGERVDDLAEPLPHLGGRKKTEMTAKEWAMSGHFLAYMKKAPFNDWSAEEQTAKRDAFVLATPKDLRMNRWGARFSKFCGVP